MKRYQDLTAFIPLLEKEKNFGEWIGSEPVEIKRDEEGNILPYVAPYVRYSLVSQQFINVVSHYHTGIHRDSMKESALEYTEANLQIENVDKLPLDIVVYYIRKVVQNERYRDGCVLEYMQNGLILKWLKRLKELDK